MRQFSGWLSRRTGENLRNEAVRALGSMSIEEELKERTRETLVGWLVDPDREAQAAALEALGQQGDAASQAI